MDAPAAIALRREPGPLARSLTALLLRLALGMIFLGAGYGKIQGLRAGTYPGPMFQGYPDRIVFPGDVALFGRVLPYAELFLGAALVLGLTTTLTATLSGALLLALQFGHVYKNNIAMYPTMLTYLLANAGILWLSPVTSNYLSVDGLLFGWFWKPRSHGEFRREGEAADPRGRRI